MPEALPQPAAHQPGAAAHFQGAHGGRLSQPITNRVFDLARLDVEKETLYLAGEGDGPVDLLRVNGGDGVEVHAQPRCLPVTASSPSSSRRGLKPSSAAAAAIS